MEKKADYSFITENSLEQKMRFMLFIGLVIFGLAVIIATVYAFTLQNPGSKQTLTNTKDFIFKETKSLSPVGLLYISFFGNLLYSWLPIEYMFFAGLAKGNPQMLSLLFVLCAVLASETVNYVAGRKLSRYIFYVISPKKIYAAKRIANKYGSFAVFFFSFIPALPSPLLTFTLGIAKYRPARLFPLLILGSTLKFGGILALFHFVQPWLTSFFSFFNKIF